jgi:phage terminase large subunit
MFKTGPLYLANLNSDKAVVVNQGGTSSGKTYTIMQVLFSIAVSEAKQIITVVGQDIPNLKVGALRDALDIWGNSPELQAMTVSYNKTDRVFEFMSGSMMEFKSYENGQDAKSGKRDYAFFNEINGIKKDIYEEIALRTRKRVYMDYNPNNRFWVHDELIGRDYVQTIISDHRHNPFLSDDIRQKIEGLKDKDLDLWKVYARGLTGKIEGLVFRNWTEIDKVPVDAKLLGIGLDFGFTNDPTAAIAMYRYNGEIILHELIYSRELTNPDIANRLSEYKQVDIIADSAEPKSIAELRKEGLSIFAADKGTDSVRAGIDLLKRYPIRITKDSVNLRKEFGGYKWATDKQGNALQKPVDYLNHGIDAVRYVAQKKLRDSGTFDYSFSRV